MLKFLIHTVFISLLVFAGSSAHAQAPDSLFASANKLYQQERYIEALEQYQNIEKLDLESASLYFNMANIYYRKYESKFDSKSSLDFTQSYTIL